MSFYSSSSSKKAPKSGKPGPGSNSRPTASSESKSASKDNSKSSSTGDDTGIWNGWEWSPQWEQYWRSRRKPDGNWEYEYRQYVDDDRTPRSAFIGAGDDQAPIGADGLDEPQFTHSPQASGGLRLSTSPPVSGKYSPAIGPGSSYGINTALRPAPVSRNFENLQRNPGLQRDVSSSYEMRNPIMMSSASVPLRGSDPQNDAEDEDDYYDDDTVATTAQKLDNFQFSSGLQQVPSLGYGTGMPAMMDNAGIPIPSSNLQLNEQEEDDYYDDDTMATSAPKKFVYSMSQKVSRPSFPSQYSPTGLPNTAYPSYSSPNTEETVAAISPSTDREPTVGSRHIVGIATVAEDSMSPREAALHGNFKVHPAKDFEFGKVFKILWTEPKGQGKATERTEIVSTIYGEQCYTSIRRFVISKPMKGHCLCLPILTYNRQGTAKAGAKAQDHAIIYTERGEKGEKLDRPRETRGEEKLTKSAIRMEPRTHRDQLDPTSRLNYAKIYTVEYNVKVSFIGKIHKNSMKSFSRDYNLTHLPLPEGEHNDYSDESQSFQQSGERDSGPHNQLEGREPAPPSRHSGHSKEKEQRDQRRKKK